MFDPELFGQAMGEEIRKAVAPLLAEISELKTQLAQRPDFTALIAQEVAKAAAAIPVPADGKDCDMEAVQTMVTAAVKALPVPKDGEPGLKGDPGDPGEKGADGIGLAGAMIDRDGALLVTLTNGTVKSLGPVVGKDGKDGTDGADGMSLESFDLAYLEETHEVAIKAACAGRTKEVRFPAGGLRPASYWREGTKAKACEAWVHDGSLWIATKDTSGKPQAQSEDWIIAARKGRDGESIVKTVPAGPPAPIKLGA
ncbi:MAG: hypothetical protein DI587_38460 [Variovorax paradoxus]|nr:MAG: hypothetical protein DI583_38460 [Variovorax paradoxus]PZP99428.1 MAG: hypothetical protein DI587_38460 [Variovorax paradoxus]